MRRAAVIPPLLAVALIGCGGGATTAPPPPPADTERPELKLADPDGRPTPSKPSSEPEKQAAAALGEWADELSESELESLRDPRNWVRPVAAIAVGGAAAGALAVVGARRRRKPSGLRAQTERLLHDLGEELRR